MKTTGKHRLTETMMVKVRMTKVMVAAIAGTGSALAAQVDF